LQCPHFGEGIVYQNYGENSKIVAETPETGFLYQSYGKHKKIVAETRFLYRVDRTSCSTRRVKDMVGKAFSLFRSSIVFGCPPYLTENIKIVAETRFLYLTSCTSCNTRPPTINSPPHSASPINQTEIKSGFFSRF
jgi:hypothetical protein